MRDSSNILYQMMLFQLLIYIQENTSGVYCPCRIYTTHPHYTPSSTLKIRHNCEGRCPSGNSSINPSIFCLFCLMSDNIKFQGKKKQSRLCVLSHNPSLFITQFSVLCWSTSLLAQFFTYNDQKKICDNLHLFICSKTYTKTASKHSIFHTYPLLRVQKQRVRIKARLIKIQSLSSQQWAIAMANKFWLNTEGRDILHHSPNIILLVQDKLAFLGYLRPPSDSQYIDVTINFTIHPPEYQKQQFAYPNYPHSLFSVYSSIFESSILNFEITAFKEHGIHRKNLQTNQYINVLIGWASTQGPMSRGEPQIIFGLLLVVILCMSSSQQMMSPQTSTS